MSKATTASSSAAAPLHTPHVSPDLLAGFSVQHKAGCDVFTHVTPE
jgi:hypothetical protein